ncbi:hypothetical protein [Virgisporangium ochraceum]|uniref:Uncharacterized protein n=1 Tax=Virgisporangium ochraceum TaxID=65505 RepID=A0A8J4EDH2_9ACTN|nr:hypothetical protein [Virgisporangium ochraceum]GIJ70588.1 hypothetical protein Voc01_055050 [Virgisporangium ochraceum]
MVALTVDSSLMWASEPASVGNAPPLSVNVSDGLILVVNADRGLVLIRT